MSKFKRKGKQQFLMLERYMVNSTAWRQSSPEERAAYLELKWRYKRTNNGQIALSVRDLAEAINVGKNTASEVLRKLQEKGFIEPVVKGAFSVKLGRATEWRLTEFQCDVTGAIPSKAFVRWVPEEKNTVPFQVRSVPPQVHSHPQIERKIA